MKTSKIIAIALVSRGDFNKLQNHPSSKVRVKVGEVLDAIIDNEGKVPSYLITGYISKLANKLCRGN